MIATSRLSGRVLHRVFRQLQRDGACLSTVVAPHRNVTPLHKNGICRPPTFSKSKRSIHLSRRRYEDATVNCPPFADSITEGDIRWEMAVGDQVSVDDTIGEVETDKTSLAVKSTVSGTITALLVEDGTTVTPGTPLVTIAVGEGGAAAPPVAAAKAEPAAPASATPPPAQEKVEIPTTLPPVPPVPSAPMSSTPTSQVKPVIAPATAAASSTGAPAAPANNRNEDRVKMTRMRLRIAERLKDAQNTCAMLTTFNEIDMSNVMELRNTYKDAFLKKHGVKLGFMSAFVRASAFALTDQPVVNAVIDGSDILYRDYVDISVAVSTPKGLVVPVLRNVENMNYAQIEKGIEELGVKAKEGSLAVEDMDGGTFTISNGGVFGSMFGTPIINPPQSSILGMHGIFNRPVAVKGQVEIRPMMYVALTYDHRLIDGREAVTFLRKIKSAVEDPRVLLVDL